MFVLMNRNYYFAFPKTNQAGRSLMVVMAKELYPKQLKFAKMVKIKERVETGKLIRRTI